MSNLPTDSQEIGRRLYARREEGVITNFAKVKIGDWRPTEHECHRNVTTWCEHQTDHKPVRGWLLFDFDNFLPFVRFTAHSVIEDENGDLVDITPTRGSQPYPFICAEEDEEAFASLIEEHGLTNFDFLK